MNRPGGFGEQSAERESRRLKGEISCRIESTARGNRTSSAHAEFGCSRKIVPTNPAAARPAPQSPRSSDAPASPMVHLGGARRRGATGPEQRRRGKYQGVAHRQRDTEEGVGLFCPGRARPPVPQMIAFIEKRREAAESRRSAFCGDLLCACRRRP